jgi:MFS family permease
VRGNDAGWHSAQVLTGLVGGGVALIVFLWWETRSKAPLIPLGLFRDRSFSVANIVGFGFSFGMFGSVFILIQFLQVVKGASPLDAAIQTTPWTMAPMIVAPLAGIIAPRVGTRVLITVGLACQSIALFWLAATMSATVAYTTMLFPFILAGIGMGLVFSPSSTAVLATMREQDRAKASGVNSTVREIGVALGIAVLVAVFTGANGQLTPTGYVNAAIPAVLVGAAVVAATTLASLALPAGRLARKSLA